MNNFVTPTGVAATGHTWRDQWPTSLPPPSTCPGTWRVAVVQVRVHSGLNPYCPIFWHNCLNPSSGSPYMTSGKLSALPASVFLHLRSESSRLRRSTQAFSTLPGTEHSTCSIKTNDFLLWLLTVRFWPSDFPSLNLRFLVFKMKITISTFPGVLWVSKEIYVTR